MANVMVTRFFSTKISKCYFLPDGLAGKNLSAGFLPITSVLGPQNLRAEPCGEKNVKVHIKSLARMDEFA